MLVTVEVRLRGMDRAYTFHKPQGLNLTSRLSKKKGYPDSIMVEIIMYR